MFEDKLKSIHKKIAKTVAANHKAAQSVNLALNTFWNNVTKALVEAKLLLGVELINLGLKPENIVQIIESQNKLVQVIVIGDMYFSFVCHKVGSIFDGKIFKLCGRVIVCNGNILNYYNEIMNIDKLLDIALSNELGSFFIFNEKLIVFRDENGKRSEFDDMDKAINSVLWGFIRDKQFPIHFDKSGSQIVFV